MKKYHVPFAVLLLAALAACDSTGKPSVTSLPEIKEAPQFEFVNYDGATVTNADFDGDIYIASFFFTSCGGPCPVINSNANVLQAEYADIEDFKIVSFTVDPDTDSLERLTKYAERYNAKEGKWYFLRRDLDAVKDVATQGFMLSAGDDPNLHSTRFALVDRNGMIRGYYDGTDAEKVNELRAAIDYLLEDNV